MLQGVDLYVGEGEIVSLLGRNGVGRSTTVKAIMGQVDHTGEIDFRINLFLDWKAMKSLERG